MLKFEDPPRSGAGAAPKLVAQLSPLREHPGRWARMFGPYHRHLTAAQKANDIKAGRFARVERGEYDAVARRLDDGQSYVWVRFVGGVS